MFPPVARSCHNTRHKSRCGNRILQSAVNKSEKERGRAVGEIEREGERYV